MAIFTAAAVATFLGIEAGFFATATAFVLNAAVVSLASIGVSYAAKAVAGHQNQPAGATDSYGVQGKLTGGGDVPRSFNLGYSVTAGSLVYANTHGGDTTTPNAYLTQVIALSDLPGGTLREFWVNGEKQTLPAPLVGGAQGDDAGYAVPEYIKQRGDGGEGVAHLYIKYYDGTQTTADPYLVGTVASEDRPYPATRVGVGVAYVVITSLVNEKLWNGFPTFKFALSGVALYDPSKDSSVGGVGAQRYDNPATWGGDGDSFPAVQVYNILRGFSYNGIWLYGLQNTSAARLPVENWITQIVKCRAPIDGPDGPEPTYRSGMQVNVNSQPANTITTLLTACQGKPSELGGFYKLRVGAPDSPSFTFTDGDIVSIEPQTFRPFFALADSVNGIQARYPDPAQGWEYDTAPAYYRADLEARDGNRRLMAQPSFDAVPYPAQVQRLQTSAIEEAQRARGHTVVLPSWYWTVEPGDVGAWTSARNGYVSKQFRVDVAVDKNNLDNALSLTEVDPADFDPAGFIPVTTGPTGMVRPAPQGIVDWDVEEWELPDRSGIGRRPAIRITWDGTLPGIVGIKWEVRLAEDGSHVTRGNSPPEASEVGAIIISQSLLPEEDYEVRIQYLPSSPRDMLWSDWRAVTTPDVRFSARDVDDGIQFAITTLQNQLQNEVADIRKQFSGAVARVAALLVDSKEFANQQAADHRVDLITRIALGDADLGASIERTQTLVLQGDAALAQDVTNLFAGLGGSSGQVNLTAIGLATANLSFASLSSDITAKLGTGFSSVSTVSQAVATLTGYAAEVTVSANVNGFVVGTKLINGGAGRSMFGVQADKFEIQLPGYNGNAPMSVFTVGTLAGVPSFGLSGNVFLDGTFHARAIISGTITGVLMTAGTVNTTQLAVNSVDINILIKGAAVQQWTFPFVASGSIAAATTRSIVATTAITIKSGTARVTFACEIFSSNSSTTSFDWVVYKLFVDGVAVRDWRHFLEISTASTGANGAQWSPFWDCTGLSVGTHTFEVKKMAGGTSSSSVGDGVLSIVDLRNST